VHGRMGAVAWYGIFGRGTTLPLMLCILLALAPIPRMAQLGIFSTYSIPGALSSMPKQISAGGWQPPAGSSRASLWT
jgi:hypothetical protein